MLCNDATSLYIPDVCRVPHKVVKILICYFDGMDLICFESIMYEIVIWLGCYKS